MSKTSSRLNSLIADLKSAARNGGGEVWRDVATRLEKPRRTHAEVNLSRIERYATEEETVVVPGKVLGGGALSKELSIAAVDFSTSAVTKIEQADGEALDLGAAVEDNPSGSDVRVIR